MSKKRIQKKPRIPREYSDEEDLLLAYRYLYYVRNISLVDDFDYDELEQEFKDFGDCPPDSLILIPGSDKAEDYPPHVKALGMYLAFKYAKAK